MPGSWDDAPTCDLCSIKIEGTALTFHVPHECEGPGMKSGLGTIYYYFPDFAYETKNLRQRMSAL